MATTKAFRVKTGLTVEGAELRPAAGTTSYPPILLTSGTNLTTATPGAFEYDGTNFYLTATTGGRKTIAFSDLAVSQATASTLGTIKLSSDTAQTVAINAVSATASRSYGLQVNASGQGMVNVPWTDTLYTLPLATDTVRGGIELFSATAQTTGANAVTTTAGRTYGIQVNAADQAVVNVPWTDTVAPAGSTTVAGILQLTDSTSSTSTTTAATPASVKTTYDLANAALPKAGGTMTGFITTHADPTSDLHVANKRYVDTVSAGINVHEAVKYATTGALGTTGNLVGGTITTTYANGTSGVDATITVATSSNWTAITIDGQSLTVNDRVLIKDQAANLQNGIYFVTQVGAVGNTTSFIFKRALDNDQSPEIDAGDLTYVIAGTVNGGDGYVQTAANITVGTTGVVWTQFSGAGAVPLATTTTAGIASFPAAQFSVNGSGAVTVATLNTSVLSAGTLGGARGGTGVDNGTKTITVSGNTTIGSGTNTVAFATSGNTNVTLPTSGTLMTTAGNTTGSAATLTTTRTIWGQNFNGSANVTGNLTSVGSITGTAGTSLTISGADVSGTTGGDAVILTSGATSGNGGTGAVLINTGNSTSGDSGNIFIDTGTGATSSGEILIGITNAPYVTIGKGIVNIGGSQIRTGTGTATSGTVSVPIFATATYQAAKVLVKMKTSTAIEVIEMLVAVNAAGTVYMTQYGDVQSNSSLGTVDASIASGIVSVDVAVGATSTTVSVSSTAI